MMEDKLRAELAFLLTASLRDESVHSFLAEFGVLIVCRSCDC